MRRRPTRLSPALASVMFLTASVAAATPQWQPPESLTRLAEETVADAQPEDGHRRVIRAQRLDPRLRLQACEQTPSAYVRDPGRRPGAYRTVAIECVAPVPWTVYVRVALETYGDVIVARRPLERGRRLSADDLRREERRLDQQPYGWFDGDDDLLGRAVLRAVAAGAVVTPASVGRSYTVVAGQEVMLKANTAGIAVRMPGEALEDGGRGDLIRVRNLRSQVVVEGIVRSGKVVEVLLQ